jgi:hypothetical protein
MLLNSSLRLAAPLAAVVWIALANADTPAKPRGPAKTPPVVDPGGPGKAPSDAIVLFDGTSLAEWTGPGGRPPGWKLEGGVLTAVPGAGNLHTRRKLGDIQLHLEFRIPVEKKQGESRGNSGIKLHEAYEIQILDNYENSSSPMGQCASVYKQHAPLANACRPPGEWQTYDIVFRAPYFDASGKEVKHGTFTVFHNGVLVQDNAEIYDGRTNSKEPVSPEYRQPFFLQEHGSAVSFRNIWVRELERRPLESPR